MWVCPLLAGLLRGRTGEGTLKLPEGIRQADMPQLRV